MQNRGSNPSVEQCTMPPHLEWLSYLIFPFRNVSPFLRISRAAFLTVSRFLGGLWDSTFRLLFLLGAACIDGVTFPARSFLPPLLPGACSGFSVPDRLISLVKSVALSASSGAIASLHSAVATTLEEEAPVSAGAVADANVPVSVFLET